MPSLIVPDDMDGTPRIDLTGEESEEEPSEEEQEQQHNCIRTPKKGSCPNPCFPPPSFILSLSGPRGPVLAPIDRDLLAVHSPHLWDV